MSDNNVFGKRLLALLNEKNMPQSRLAELLGLDRSSINKYIKGNSKPSLETLEKISEFFNVSTDYLLGKTDNIDGNEEKNQELQEFKEYYLKLSPEMRKKALKMLELFDE